MSTEIKEMEKEIIIEPKEVSTESPKEEVEVEKEDPKDLKIREDLKSIEEQYLYIAQKISINHSLFKEYLENASFETEEEQALIESRKEFRNIKKTFQENEIKFEKLLFSLDSLVGASESLRPIKKSLVSKIQKEISGIEKLLGGALKTTENQIEQKLKEIKEKQVTTQETSKLEETQVEEESEEVEEPPEIEEEEEVKEESPKNSPKQIHLQEKKEEESTFPLPTKQEWEILKFEPKFAIEGEKGKIVLSSKITNLETETLKIEERKGHLIIEGVKYPTQEEQNLLVKKFISSIPNPSLLRNLSKKQIVAGILRIASQYNFGKFRVVYELPSNIDSSEEIGATYKNHLLRIELPIVRQNNFYSQHPQNFYRPEVPFYNQRTRKQANPFWGYF